MLGAGQLGRMLALAGYRLGFDFSFLDPSPESCAALLGHHLVADYDDPVAIQRFAESVDLVTYEFENVPVDAARQLARLVPVYPPPAALSVAQDRLTEKEFLTGLGIPCPTFCAVSTLPELEAAVATLRLPAVLKTRRMGYDGKGQWVLRQMTDLPDAWEGLGGGKLILESLVPFDRELSVLAVRGRKGEFRCYPLIENHHKAGMLRLSLAPAANVGAELQQQAELAVRRVMEELGYVGVLAMELFQIGDELLANEMAPRVHNSGHWTIEGAETSQFENHLRAVAGLPLGATSARGCSGMLNIIGAQPDPRAVLTVERAHLHLYGKQPRPGRKLGHVTVQAADHSIVNAGLQALERHLSFVAEG